MRPLWKRRACFVAAILLAGSMMAGCRHKAQGGGRGEKDIFRDQPADPGEPLASLPPTKDPQVALQHMLEAYKAVSSLKITAVSYGNMVVPNGNNPLYQTTILLYQKTPPRLAMDVRDPMNGTKRYFADGSSFVTYYGPVNSYTRRDYTGDLANVSTLIDKDSPQSLDPVLFLQKDPLSGRIRNVTMARTENVSGKPTYVIHGEFTPEFVNKVGQSIGPRLTPDRSDFTLWLDQNTYMLVKSHSKITWKGSYLVPNPQFLIQNPFIDMTETLQAIPNPHFPPRNFDFVASKGMTGLYIQKSNGQ